MAAAASQIAPVLTAGLGRRPIDLSPRRLLLIIVVAGAFYGAVMGTYGSEVELRPLQVLFSAIKVPILLIVSFLLTLPAVFVISTLLGLRADWAESLRALIVTQAVVAVVLAALAPYTALCYLSTPHYQFIQVFNLAMFSVASLTGQYVLRRCYGPLIRRRPMHRVVMWGWLVVYGFVGVQLAWTLRPFIGVLGAPTQFFRDEPFSNAYVVVARIIWRALGMS